MIVKVDPTRVRRAMNKTYSDIHHFYMQFYPSREIWCLFGTVGSKGMVKLGKIANPVKLKIIMEEEDISFTMNNHTIKHYRKMDFRSWAVFESSNNHIPIVSNLQLDQAVNYAAHKNPLPTFRSLQKYPTTVS